MPMIRRLRAEEGFTMLIALGVMLVTALLTAAAFAAVNGDIDLTHADLDGKQAYAAAQAGMQAYLYNLNDNASTSNWWETCSNDSTSAPVSVPGSTTHATYTFVPVPANGNTSCVTSDPVNSLIDTSTGTLRMEFTGHSGSATRTIVASFRTLSPLSFLWYTVYETEDSSLPGATNCDRMYYDNPGPPSNCDINWVSGDHMNGPMYTHDQFYIYPGASPTFGRGPADAIASEVPTKGANDICASSNCQGDPNILGTREPDVSPQVPLPNDNSNLLSDATKHGMVYTGSVTLTIDPSGTTASGWNCTGSTASTCTAISSLNLVTHPIIYAQNGSGCSSSYTPTSITYPAVTPSSGHTAYAGACGDIYIQGTYSTPLTLAAADDVIVTGSLLNSTDSNGNANPSGGATMGLVANQYVRVMHTCSGNPNVTIDSAILTLQHSFFVDNYDCGGTPLGTLTVHGAIAQYFRGIVGEVNASGYLKNYNYDDRLSLILPPYLFDLQNTEWQAFRETLCSTTVSHSATNSCSNYTGT